MLAAPALRILFLDFDGVLNHARHLERVGADREVDDLIRSGEALDHAAVARVNDILARTGARVVISSTWRERHGKSRLRAILERHGFTGRIIGTTPVLLRPRGLEICAWLEEHEDVVAFAILDDRGPMPPLDDHLVQTDEETGLLDEHVEAAVRLLGDR